MTTPELTCQELVELVTNYLEGALSPVDQRRFEAHLATCSGCAAYLTQIRTTIGLLHRLRETDLPPDARDALLSAFRTWHSE